MSNTAPMGVPDGSVRSYLALGLVFGVLFAAITNGTVDPTLGTLAAAACGFYYGTRTPSTPVS